VYVQYTVGDDTFDAVLPTLDDVELAHVVVKKGTAPLPLMGGKRSREEDERKFGWEPPTNPTAASIAEVLDAYSDKALVKKITLAEGLKVNAEFSDRFKALVPHVWVQQAASGADEAATLWRREFVEFIQRAGVDIKQPHIRAELYELIDALTTWLASVNLAALSRKAAWATPFTTLGQIVYKAVLGLAGHEEAVKAQVSLRTSFEKGFVDITAIMTAVKPATKNQQFFRAKQSQPPKAAAKK
jgi:hypothetical protein